MTIRLVPSGNTLLCGSGITALLLAAWCSPTLAASGVDVECPESERETGLVAADLEIPELVIPSLAIDVADHGIDSAASIDEEIVDSPLATQVISSGDESEDSAPDIDEGDAPLDDAAPTATRLPGVSETDQPRYRRQMYRTDI